jgi:6,7-dimethyl-8-ribityllumazine synthase
MSDEHDDFPHVDPGPAIGTGEPPSDIHGTIAYPPPAAPLPDYPETTVAAAEPEAAPADEPSEAAPLNEPEAPAQPVPAATTVEEEPEVEQQAPDVEEAEDPFGDWPQPESAEVIEDLPESGAAEHDAGEIDVPDGYTVLEGTPSGLRRSVAVVVSRYNGGLTNKMLARAIEALEEAGVASDAVTIMPVPGAFELPLAAMALAKTRRYACVVALGAIVRGETAHFDFVASEAASGLQLAAIETGVPVAFGVLTVDTVEQAEARIDRAADAVHTALEMADVFAQLRASARG